MARAGSRSRHAHPRPVAERGRGRRVRRHRRSGRLASAGNTGPSACDRRRRRFFSGLIVMLLVIDAGNTNIVFAVHDGKTVRAEWRAVTETTRTADEYAVMLLPLMQLQGLSLSDVDSAIIATVVPAALFDLKLLCRR